MKGLAFSVATFAWLVGAASAQATEFYIGEPVTKNGMQVVANYLTAEEFDSSALKIEKVIVGNGEGLVRKSHGLDAGRYEFIGEYHADTAKGVLIAE